MDKKRWKMIIAGKVQGVYYRASTDREANRLGITGYARNLPDGRVEVVAEGAPDDLRVLHQWCLDGPAEARVTGIEIEEQPATGEFNRFGIRY